MTNHINIALTCDDGFAHYCAETMVSILMNSHKNDVRYTFYVIGNLREETQDKIKRISDIKPCEIIFISMPEFDSDDIVTKAINYRVKLPSLLPHLDKVIYSDCDVTFVGDISELWEEDIADYYLGMCSNSIKKSQQINIKAEFIKSGVLETDFNLDKHQTYFNSGLLLMNLKKMRDDGVEEKLLYFMRKYSYLPLVDQDMLNLVCYDEIKELGLKWNFLLSYFKLRPSQVIQKYRAELSDLKKNKHMIKMIHFIGKNKPNKIYKIYLPHIITPVNEYKKLFKHYLDRSGFMDADQYQKTYWKVI